MTIDLEERIRRAAQLLDDEAMQARDALPLSGFATRQAVRRRSVMVSVAAACMLAVGGYGMFLVAGRDPSSAPATGELPTVDGPPVSSAVLSSVPAATIAAASVPSATTIPPEATLPALADVSLVVPPTVVGTGPTDWYRLQPDLDVAWYSDGAGTRSMLCFRTPAGQECQLDEFAPTTSGGGPIGVRSVDNQMLVLTLDPASTVTVTFDNGQTVSSPVERDAQTGWAVARVAFPPGSSSPEGLSMWFDMTDGGAAVPVATAPTSEPVPTIAG